MYSCHLFLISSASVAAAAAKSLELLLGYTISDLYCAHLCIKYSLGISNFLEEVSSISHSVVFFCFFALITEVGFLISPCYSLKLCIQMGISFIFSFAFLLLFFSQLFVRPPQPFCLFAFLFLQDVLITAFCTMSRTSVHSSNQI